MSDRSIGPWTGFERFEVTIGHYQIYRVLVQDWPDGYQTAGFLVRGDDETRRFTWLLDAMAFAKGETA